MFCHLIRSLLVFLTAFTIISCPLLVFSQGIQQTPYSSPALLRGLSGQGLDMAPSNPLRGPGTSGPWSSRGSDSITLSSGMFQGLLPPIPNLQLGYLYSSSNNYGAGRVTGDYLKPFSLSKESFVFGEAHAEGWNFWSSGGTNGNSGGGVNNRVDMSLGGGYRKFFGNQALIGINGFYDTTRLTGKWYSSGSLGLQAAWLLPGSDALDLNFNWYGKLLRGREWINTFRHGPSNYDFEAGYSHELWNGGPDLRLKIKGYHFDVGSNLNGWSGGAELKSRDGMFVLKYEAGYDRLDNTYQTIGGYINVGCQVENILKGESPFTAPEPIFRSPRNLTNMANQPVQRNWSQPNAAVLTRPGQAQGNNLDRFIGTVTMVHKSSGYVNFSPVPYALLDPNGIITVEFDYVFDVDPEHSVYVWLEVSSDPFADHVINASDVFDYSSGISGHFGPVPLINAAGSLPVQYQAAFTSTAKDPAQFNLDFGGHSKATNVTITNFVIHFNQPAP